MHHRQRSLHRLGDTRAKPPIPERTPLGYDGRNPSASDRSAAIPGLPDGSEMRPTQRPARSTVLLSDRELAMKTIIKGACAVAALGLLVSCSRNDGNPRSAEDTGGEPAGEVGTLTDVPTEQPQTTQSPPNPSDASRNAPTRGPDNGNSQVDPAAAASPTPPNQPD